VAHARTPGITLGLLLRQWCAPPWPAAVCNTLAHCRLHADATHHHACMTLELRCTSLL
jgi:hypothetical protein